MQGAKKERERFMASETAVLKKNAVNLVTLTFQVKVSSFASLLGKKL